MDSVEINQRHTRQLGLTYSFLSDTRAEVIRRYDLLHAGGGPGGTDISRPGEFLVDKQGVVRWLNLTDNLSVRARPEQLLKAFDEMSGKTAAN